MGKRMKRFTRWRNDHRVIAPKNLSRDEKGDFMGPAVNQLAAYEDTGLTPAQVVALLKERENLLSQIGILECQTENLEAELMITRSEREYFRSRAEFFQEMALCKQEKTIQELRDSLESADLEMEDRS